MFGILCAELIVVRRGIDPAMVAWVGLIDLGYGAAAGAIVVAGFSRAIFAANGWGYYSQYAFFWTKIGVFVLIGLLSVPPTIALIRWPRAGMTPSNDHLAEVRRFMLAELALFALPPAFAAAMARV